jgi:predicted RNA binding protein YcfA (HicA-like mRNA interferase family)
LIDSLRKLGFDGPYPGGKHEFMVKDSKHVVLPNPHNRTIGRPFLARILRQAGVTREEWEAV